MAEEKELNPLFWEQRYVHHDTPWDIGQVSPAIKHFIDGITDKSTRILIPGAGKSHEALYLHQHGFEQVHVCDWAPSAFDSLREHAPDFPEEHLWVSDFFELALEVDLILEQTFFCAIHPKLRTDYVQKADELLSGKGELAGLLFAQPFPFEGPPFGGTREEYKDLFSTHFEILSLAPSSLSVTPRLGNELFLHLRKP